MVLEMLFTLEVVLLIVLIHNAPYTIAVMEGRLGNTVTLCRSAKPVWGHKTSFMSIKPSWLPHLRSPAAVL